MNDIKIHPIYGPMKIIDYPYKLKPGYIKIKFLNTNNIITTQKSHFNNLDCVDDMYKLYLKRIFITISGPANIISFLGPNINGDPIVVIKYGNTEFIDTVLLNNLIDNNVIDKSFDEFYNYIVSLHNLKKYSNIDIERLYASNQHGLFKIISIIDSMNCYVKFISTRYLGKFALHKVLCGQIADKYQQRILPFNKDYLGVDYDYWIKLRLKSKWNNMISRCTNNNAACYEAYGGSGVTIYDEWYDFNRFYNDIKTVPQYDKFYNNPFLYHLDKDYYQLNIPKNQRIYSPQTCTFLHNLDNINIESYEKHKNSPEMFSSLYYGVTTKNKGKTFRANIKINGTDIYLGTFSNEIAAASCYNYWHRKYHAYELFPLFNNINEMDPLEFFKYNIKPKMLYNLI